MTSPARTMQVVPPPAPVRHYSTGDFSPVFDFAPSPSPPPAPTQQPHPALTGKAAELAHEWIEAVRKRGHVAPSQQHTLDLALNQLEVACALIQPLLFATQQQ